MWLIFALSLEVLLRLGLEIRECRQTQGAGAIRPKAATSWVFAALRVIPLVNDFAPLPESRRSPATSDFITRHEAAHRELHHGILRNIVKIIFLLLAVWALVALLARFGLPLVEALLWLHLLAIPFRTFFHYYCWKQEYEADAWALKQLDRRQAKTAMHDLSIAEYQYTTLFALIYREHPTAALRTKKLFQR